MFIGSGDLLNRNTQRRVEAFVEVTTPETRRQVLEVMDALRSDDVKGWDMHPDGSYTKAELPEGQDSQERLSVFFARQLVEPLPPDKPQKKAWFSSLFRRLKEQDA